MDGIHDLGGTEGLGPITAEKDEPVFHADWEKAAFAMFPALFIRGFYNLDEFRHGIEKMHPVEYLTSRYYEHWAHSFELYARRAGVLDEKELEERTQHYLQNPEAELPASDNPELADTIEGIFGTGATARRETGAKPKFTQGDQVRVSSEHPRGHTRMAGYIRGKTGVVEQAHGAFIYPDSAGNGKGEDPQHVYTVRFDAAELWGEHSADPNSSVYFDVWEPYIQAA